MINIRNMFRVLFIIMFLFMVYSHIVDFSSEVAFVLMVLPVFILDIFCSNNGLFIASNGGISALTPLGMYIFYGALVLLSIIVPVVIDRYKQRKTGSK